MRVIAIIVGILLMVLGVIWILQGVSILSGSFMTGHIKWAIYGAAAVIVGLLVLIFGTKHRSSPTGPEPPKAPAA